jgi:hypothetical protein
MLPGYSKNLEVLLTAQSTVVLINRKGMGEADPELQMTLMETYLRTIHASAQPPSEICFYGEGVFLVVAGSPVLHLLSLLEAQGVRLTACSTCLNFYGLTDQVAVGQKGTMVEIVEAQNRADKVMTL